MARIDVTELRERFRAVPQKLILELLGFRQWTELQRFADKWRLSIGGKTTDLFVLFRELRSFAAKYGPVLSALIEDLPTDGSEGELGVRYLRAKIAKTEADAQMAQLRVAEREGRLRDVRLVSQSLDLLANRIRNSTEMAQRRWGEPGREFFQELVDGFGSDLKTFFDAERQKRDSADPQAIESKL